MRQLQRQTGGRFRVQKRHSPSGPQRFRQLLAGRPSEKVLPTSDSSQSSLGLQAQTLELAPAKPEALQSHQAGAIQGVPQGRRGNILFQIVHAGHVRVPPIRQVLL